MVPPMRIALTVAAMAALSAIPAALSAAPPVVLVQAGHLSPGEPGYMLQTGASGNPFGLESEFNRRVRDDLVTRLKAAGVDARPLAARVEPLGVAGATFVSVHHDSPGGAAMVGRAVTGRGENWYHGEGTGDASATPYADSAPHRKPATKVTPAVERTSTALATRIAKGLKAIYTPVNGARGNFNGLVGRTDYVRMNHFYGYYRTNAQARVLVEVGAAPEDNGFLKRTDVIGKALTAAIVADLKARKLL